MSDAWGGVSPDSLEQLGRASRRGALVSLLGFLAVLAAMGYGIYQLHTLQAQRDSMRLEVQRLTSETTENKQELLRVQSDLSKARASLAAARAAINAFHAGRLEDAVKLYDEALAADPNNAYLENLKAYSLFRLRRVDAALEAQRLSVAADPDYAWGYFDLARFLCASSPPRLDEAKQAAAKAISIRPDIRATMQDDGEFQQVCKRQIP